MIIAQSYAPKSLYINSFLDVWYSKKDLRGRVIVVHDELRQASASRRSLEVTYERCVARYAGARVRLGDASVGIDSQSPAATRGLVARKDRFIRCSLRAIWSTPHTFDDTLLGGEIDLRGFTASSYIRRFFRSGY
jgi:hypothetical protein